MALSSFWRRQTVWGISCESNSIDGGAIYILVIIIKKLQIHAYCRKLRIQILKRKFLYNPIKSKTIDYYCTVLFLHKMHNTYVFTYKTEMILFCSLLLSISGTSWTSLKLLQHYFIGYKKIQYFLYAMKYLIKLLNTETFGWSVCDKCDTHSLSKIFNHFMYFLV